MLYGIAASGCWYGDGPAPVPFGAVAPPVETDAMWIQKELNRRGATPPLLVDGNRGPRSLAAIRKFMENATSG